MVYLLVDLAKMMIWDYTKRNQDILKDGLSNDYTRSIMTEIK